MTPIDFAAGMLGPPGLCRGCHTATVYDTDLCGRCEERYLREEALMERGIPEWCPVHSEHCGLAACAEGDCLALRPEAETAG